MKNHFHAASGWINDPNGLCYFNGKYHMFFQHNPYDIVWDKMHWGHAVSDDLIKWTELPIALYPDKEYEAGLGCFSGSAVVTGMAGKEECHIFYTAVDKEKNQAQCHAAMDSSGKITKYPGNPFLKGEQFAEMKSEQIIQMNDERSDDKKYEEIINPKEFRDPKVVKLDNEYLMVLGTGTDGIGRVVFFRSSDLFRWEYGGVLIEGAQYGPVIECPDFFPLGDKFVLVFSVMTDKNCGTRYLVGDFDGSRFACESEFKIEQNPHFYAPQSFEKDGRRIQIGWLRDIYKSGEQFCGAMSIPRELVLKNGELSSYPIKEFRHLLKKTDGEYAAKEGMIKCIKTGEVIYNGDIRSVEFLRDDDLVEIFINGGQTNICLREPDRA